MGLGDRRRALLHRGGDGGCITSTSRLSQKPARHATTKRIQTEELDNLEFVLPPSLEVGPSRLIHNDVICSPEPNDSQLDAKLPAVTAAEVDALVKECADSYDRERFDDLLKECKTKVVEGIVVPFGLGGIVARLDKNGGNVDTIHNAREGVYATEEERARYANRGEYDGGSYHSHANYRKKNALTRQGPVEDVYAGGNVVGKPNLDHVVSANEVHNDRGRVLAGVSGEDLANIDANLQFTNEHINKTKRERPITRQRQPGAKLDDYITYRREKIATLSEQISNLERKAKAGPLSASQQQSLDELKRAKAKFDSDGFDEDRARAADEKARKEIEKTINKAYYGSGKFCKAVALTGATEGLKMGWQQALGLALTEFFVGVIDEARDAYKNGFKIDDKGFWESLKTRFQRIVKRVVARWRAALDAFKQGFLSGFLSNLVTVIINCVMRTGKNAVRMIREGFFSLFRAVKILLTRPNGMSMREAAHEATKIIATGLVIAGGIVLAEWLDIQIKLIPILETVSDILIAVVSGVVTGIVSALVVYSLDQMDLFDVNARRKHSFIMKRLADMLDVSLSNSQVMLEAMDGDIEAMDARIGNIERKTTSILRMGDEIEALDARIRQFSADSVFL